MSLRDLLKGTGVALVTPFKGDGSVDYDGLQNLINFVIDGGVQYVVTLGTTGETPTLTREEKLEIIDFTYNAVAGRVPVVVGIAGNNTQAVVKDIETYPLNKAAAILSASPHYNRPSQEGIYQHYKALASATAKPIILYNVPSRTGSNIEVETMLRLAGDFDNITGVKEASGNIQQCIRLLADKSPDFFVASGDDNLALPQIASGMNGLISVAANAFPKDVSYMVNCLLEGDLVGARAHNKKLIDAYEMMFRENSPAGIKTFLSELGIIEAGVRLPLVPPTDALAAEIKAFVRAYNQTPVHA